jgi:hypothetical protein
MVLMMADLKVLRRVSVKVASKDDLTVLLVAGKSVATTVA